MKREVIQDFLNLPGIAGVALMDGRSRPYFCGVDQTLNFQQKEALAQGILRVIETIPDGFETFEFQFTGHQVHIYKLDHGIILLVLTSKVIDADYLKTIKNLKAVLKEDITNAIATFRLIAGNVTNFSNTGSTTTSGNNFSSPPAVRTVSPPADLATPLTTPSAPANHAAVLAPATITPAPATTTPAPAAATDATLKDLLTTLNHFSKFTAQYLGTHVIVNYWKSTRPNHDWLGNFQIDRSAQFTFTGSGSEVQQTQLTPQEKQWIQEWIAGFIKRCSQVIRDFPNIVEQKAFDKAQKALLLGDRR
jgi:hypothetical protein